MKRIVVPVDFSPFSENALAAAIIIADKTGASISLVHVVPTNWAWHELSEQEKQKHKQLLSQGQAAEEKLESICTANASVSIDKNVLYLLQVHSL